VIWFLPLFWKHPDVFLPHFRLEAPKRIAANAGPIRDAFGLLSDEISKCEYLAQLRLLVSAGGALEELPPLPEGPIYFPADIVRIEEKEVFLDCGAYDGDTIRSFLDRAKSGFSRIVAFEPDPASARRLAENVSRLESTVGSRVTIRPSAIGGVTGEVRFAATGGEGSGVDRAGKTVVESVALDDVADAGSATFIKLDIEGLEMDALRGAKKLISRGTPLLAVCVYHVADHLWSVPLLLSELSDRYRYFLRRHADEFTEVVCYAVPIDRVSFGARGVPEA
jgi:FkbM family methyltransferase